MRTLREDLRALAAQAPGVDLADRAVGRARRRRAARLTAVAVSAVCLITAGTALVIQQVRPPQPPIVLTPPETKALPLPEKGVGPVEHVYQPSCLRPGTNPCEQDEWRIVTRDGGTYAFAPGPGPIAVTVDGRRIAYYSAERQSILVRDLGEGKVWKSPLKQPKEDFDVEFALRLSPSGLRFIVSGWGGRRQPNKLVDIERDTVTELPRGWYPIGVTDGDGPVVLVKPYENSTQVQVLGHDPITIDEFTYDFSALSPDGLTLARLGQDFDRDRRPMIQGDGTIVTFDPVRGGAERRVPISGVPEGLALSRLGGWLNANEVTLLAVPESGRVSHPPMVYAVDVRTGQAREQFALRDGKYVVPGLVQ
ncbi:hypothetical protein [Nonomuraea zeae]|uniref:WD40 repeat domain-containing protein n=1 Tax=Nonomuraea zeae TaxID=1642303 RepID=A0A5S4GHB5_9ACTN|nr:hypothetical protein [Nonomuraea zeae]TMR31921.1 hypothetical protein ETD85_24295 [Nonomuraea zeae]